MKKIIIIPSNTDLNRGDQALVWESIRLIEDVYGGKSNVECVLMSDIESNDSIMQNRQTSVLGYKFIDQVLKHPGRKFKINDKDSKSYSKITMLKWGGQAVIDFCKSRFLLSSNSFFRNIGLLFLTERQKKTIKIISDADAVFVKGGGFIHSYGAITDAYLIYYQTFHIRLAELLCKRVIMLPNSIGPLKNNIAREMVTKCLRKCSLVTVRENISKKCLEEIGVESLLFPDLGFFLSPSKCDMKNYLQRCGVPIDKKKVIITLRPYRFQGYSNPISLFENYINGVVNLVNYLINHNYHVSFMAHTLGPSAHENDSIAIKEVLNQLSESTRSQITFLEDYELNCKDVEKIYSYYDYMIGTRFHSVIFSLNVNIPAIAIAYGGNKGKGIMNILGNDDYSIDMDKIQYDTIVNMFRKLERNRYKYIENLKEKRLLINSKRLEFINKTKEILRL